MKIARLNRVRLSWIISWFLFAFVGAAHAQQSPAAGYAHPAVEPLTPEDCVSANQFFTQTSPFIESTKAVLKRVTISEALHSRTRDQMSGSQRKRIAHIETELRLIEARIQLWEAKLKLFSEKGQIEDLLFWELRDGTQSELNRLKKSLSDVEKMEQELLAIQVSLNQPRKEEVPAADEAPVFEVIQAPEHKQAFQDWLKNTPEVRDRFAKMSPEERRQFARRTLKLDNQEALRKFQEGFKNRSSHLNAESLPEQLDQAWSAARRSSQDVEKAFERFWSEFPSLFDGKSAADQATESLGRNPKFKR